MKETIHSILARINAPGICVCVKDVLSNNVKNRKGPA